MYTLIFSRRFQRSLKKLQRSGKFSTKLASDFETVLRALGEGRSLPAAYRDHALAGDFLGYRECHLRGDLLLVYRSDAAERIIDIVNIGSHSQLFG